MEQTAAAIYITEAEQIALAKYRTVSLREHPENLITEQIAFAKYRTVSLREHPISLFTEQIFYPWKNKQISHVKYK